MKKIIVIIFGLIIASCYMPANNGIEGNWKLKDIASTGQSDNANFTIAALFTLEAVPAFVDISKQYLLFKDKNGAAIDSTRYVLATHNTIKVINGNDTTSGKWKVNKNDLELNFGDVSYTLTKNN